MQEDVVAKVDATMALAIEPEAKTRAKKFGGKNVATACSS
jgi:hypothetical protein